MFSKNHHQKSSCESYTHDNRFHALSVKQDSQDGNDVLQITESSRETVHSDNNQNQKHPIKKNRLVNRKQYQKQLSARVILGDSKVKEVRRWKLSD